MRLGVAVVLAGLVLAACERTRPSHHELGVTAKGALGAARPADAAREFGVVEGRLATCGERLPLPCEIRDTACQSEIFELATCLYGEHGHRPELRFVSERTLFEERAAQRERVEPLAFALEHLGLAAVSEAPPARERGPIFTAFYVPRYTEVWTITTDALASDSEAAGLVLLHEYVHALQDRDGSLAHAHETRSHRSFDADLALFSAVEGEATFYEEVVRAMYYGRRIGDWVPSRLALRTSSSDEAILRQRFPLVASFALFPYTYGADFATRQLLAGVSPWIRAREEALSTREVMAARHGWWSEPPPPCAELEDASFAGGLRRTGSDSLGGWMMQAYVRKHTGDAELARRAARDLHADVLTTYDDDAQRRRFVWRTCFGSLETASAVHDVIDAELASHGSPSYEVTRRNHVVVASVVDGLDWVGARRRLRD